MTALLVAAGYDAYSVAGGTTAWARSGRALEPGAPASSDHLGSRPELEEPPVTTDLTIVPIETPTTGLKRVDVAELYDEQAYRPRVRHLLNKPMFLY